MSLPCMIVVDYNKNKMYKDEYLGFDSTFGLYCYGSDPKYIVNRGDV